MPLFARVKTSVRHKLPTNSTWKFSGAGCHGSVTLAMFSAPGVIAPAFARRFTVVVKAVMAFLDANGWGETGSWVQVLDEPAWTDKTDSTLENVLAMMKLYKSIDPRIKIYQTRWPQGGGNTQPTLSKVAAQPLYDHVDWWCLHVCQAVATPARGFDVDVPHDIDALRAAKAAQGRIFRATVYNNGVPLIESPSERERSQA
tara:strand:- start:171 stop:773 length:603 start_codon:yes stop_codon:yes gene_type:complete